MIETGAGEARAQRSETTAETRPKELTGMMLWAGRHRRKGAKAEILLLIPVVPQEVTYGPPAAMLGRSSLRVCLRWGEGGGGCHFRKVSN